MVYIIVEKRKNKKAAKNDNFHAQLYSTCQTLRIHCSCTRCCNCTSLIQIIMSNNQLAFSCTAAYNLITISIYTPPKYIIDTSRLKIIMTVGTVT